MRRLIAQTCMAVGALWIFRVLALVMVGAGAGVPGAFTAEFFTPQPVMDPLLVLGLVVYVLEASQTTTKGAQ